MPKNNAVETSDTLSFAYGSFLITAHTAKKDGSAFEDMHTARADVDHLIGGAVIAVSQVVDTLNAAFKYVPSGHPFVDHSEHTADRGMTINGTTMRVTVAAALRRRVPPTVLAKLVGFILDASSECMPHLLDPDGVRESFRDTMTIPLLDPRIFPGNNFTGLLY